MSNLDTKEPYKVKQAVILAAGLGERLRPVTLTTPKPLVKVHGVRMIDSIISALHQNGIKEIYVVTGYKAEQFASLPEQYPGLHLISNPLYATCHTISSLYAARGHLEDCLIIDGDQRVYNPRALSPYFIYSGYQVTWREEELNDWIFKTGEDDIIQSCIRSGAGQGWEFHPISRWTAEDGRKLSRHVEIEFERGNTQIYWEDVPVFCYPQEYTLGIRRMEKGDIIEIDTMEELIALDPAYRNQHV